MGWANSYGKTDPWAWKGAAGLVAPYDATKSRYGLGLPVYGAVYDEVTSFITAEDIQLVGGKMGKTVPYEVDLTQADIANGCKSKASNCPAALAINRVVAPLGLYSSVGGFSTDFYDEPVPLGGFEDGRPPVATITNPAILRMFVAAFDAASEVSPFRFTINLPADLPRHKLALTEKEAATLQAILAKVGGDDGKGPRGHAGSVATKLRKLTGNHWDNEEYKLSSGSIMFRDYGSEPNLSPWL